MQWFRVISPVFAKKNIEPLSANLFLWFVQVQRRHVRDDQKPESGHPLLSGSPGYTRDTRRPTSAELRRKRRRLQGTQRSSVAQRSYATTQRPHVVQRSYAIIQRQHVTQRPHLRQRLYPTCRRLHPTHQRTYYPGSRARRLRNDATQRLRDVGTAAVQQWLYDDVSSARRPRLVAVATAAATRRALLCVAAWPCCRDVVAGPCHAEALQLKLRIYVRKGRLRVRRISVGGVL